VILGLGVWVVIDQFVYPEVGSTTNNTCNTIDLYRTTAFSEVISLIQQKLLLVKIFSICLKSKLAPFYKDMRVVIQALIINEPNKIMYGSDWPHVLNKEINAAISRPSNPADYKKIDDKAVVSMY
jgi:hypothetical protein